jgi:hypothetical protein
MYLHKRTPVVSVCKISVIIFIMKSKTNLNSHFLRTGKECTFVTKKFPKRRDKTNEKMSKFRARENVLQYQVAK